MTVGHEGTLPATEVRHQRVKEVLRTRLVNRVTAEIDSGADVLMIVAPAGSGKSMVLRQWTAHACAHGDLVVSLSLSPDAGFRSLWPDILGSIGAALEDREHSDLARRLMRLGPPEAQGFPADLGEVIDDLSRRIFVVLDDIHAVAATAAADQLARLLTVRSNQLVVLLSGRLLPSMSLSRQVIEGRAVELGLRDLAFTEAEARDLCLRHGLHLDEVVLRQLIERTEGWAAGLRLAAVALAAEDDAAAYVARFSGDERAVSDYLITELLANQPPEIQDFLLATAAPLKLTVELAQHLARRDDAGGVLDHLVRCGALVERTIQGDQYHYHPLLRTYLIAESGRRSLARQQKLEAETAEWFVERDEPSLALEHAVRSTHWSRVVELIDRLGVEVLVTDGPDGLRRILNRLSTEAAATPAAVAMRCLVSLDEADVEAARRELAVLARGHELDEHDRLLSTIVQIRDMASSGVDQRHADSLKQLVSELRPDEIADRPLALLAGLAVGAARIVLDEFDAAERELATVVRLSCRDGYDWLTVAARAQLCIVATVRCDFTRMAEHAQTAVDLATARGWTSAPVMAFPYAALAYAAGHSDDVARMAGPAEQARALLDADADVLSWSAVTITASIAGIVEGRDPVAAAAGLRRVWEARPHVHPSFIAQALLAELDVALEVGDHGLAEGVLGTARERIPGSGDERVLRALADLHRGHDTRVSELITPVLSGQTPCHALTSMVVAWILRAHVDDGAGDPAGSMAAARAALALAAPRGMLRYVSGISPQVRSMLNRNRGRFGQHEETVERALRLYRSEPGAPGMLHGEPLTTREIQLLADLPSMLSLGEIASSNFLSVNTVKTHMKSIYRKLGVASRREAVEKARELGLL